MIFMARFNIHPNMKNKIGSQFLIFLFSLNLNAQTGTWTTHADYNSAKGIEAIKNKIYCFSNNGFFYFDKDSKETKKLSRIDGFSEVEISQIRYSSAHKKLIIAYQSGGLDIVELDETSAPKDISSIDFIKNTTAIQGSKRINQIEFQNDFAYLATDFGLVIFDLKKNEIKETYQNLGENGSELSIQQMAFSKDSIFLKTSKNIIGTLFSNTNNLQYYGNWTTVSNAKLFQKPVFPKDNLIIAPTEIETDSQGKTWIADAINGLLSNFEGSFKKYNPTGVDGDVFQLFYQNSTIYAVGSNTQVYEENQWKIIQNQPNLTKKLTDQFGNTWESSGFGVTVRNPQTNQSRTFSTGKNYGNLPSGNVNCIVEDREGLIWIGTDNGLAVIANSREIISRATDAYQPIYQGRRLYLQEDVKAIAVDGGNRKWFGTPRGISLYNATTDELIKSFTTENSPIPSNSIYDIAINSTDGEVFFATEKGLISYKSDATEPSKDFSNVKIYPNPIRPEFQGVLTISGLTNNSFIKITDASTRLIYETKSNGGTATWNLQDNTGKRASTGVYLIFSVSESGNDSFVGKFLMIN